MKPLIMTVDDEKSNLMMLTVFLDEKYEVIPATSGIQALGLIERRKPDVILLDYLMPGMSGMEMLKKLKSNPKTDDIPVVILTGTSDDRTQVECLKSGANDFIQKPIVKEVLLARISHILELYQFRKRMECITEEQIHKRTSMQQEIINVMADLIESRDGDTGEHIKRTSQYVNMIAKQLKKNGMYTDILTESYITDMTSVSVLHDIGKIKISDIILNKPASLTREEFDEMKKHARYGGEIIRDSLFSVGNKKKMDIAAKMAEFHHERWDGTGYPNGLSGEGIPLCARIMALADVFDALVSKRVYKPEFPLEKAYEIVEESSGKHFDPNVANVFLQLRPQVESMISGGSMDAENGISNAGYAKNTYAKKSVLVADDSSLQREIVEDELLDIGFNVDAAADGAEALALIKKNGIGLYDMIFLDTLMPETDGIEVAKLIRDMDCAYAKSVPIIGMSASFDSEYESELKAGMNECIEKPAERDVLCSLAEKYI